MVEEVCPFCESSVGADDAFCATCGEALSVYDDDYDGELYDDGVEYDDDPDREILAGTTDGDDVEQVYEPRPPDERRNELLLLAGVLAVTLVVGLVLGWLLGWWGGGGGDEDASGNDSGAGAAQAVEVASDASAGEVPADLLPQPIAMEELDGLSVALRDPTGVHVVHADGRDSLNLPATPRSVDMNGGSVALSGENLLYVDAATIRLYDFTTESLETVIEGDWVAAVPGDPTTLWVVDRREDDEFGSRNVLLHTDLEGSVLSIVELPQETRLDGATSRGVIVFDPVSGIRTVIGPDGFEAELLATTGPAGSVPSPDGVWLLRSDPGEILAWPLEGTVDDELIVILVPAEPASAVDFVVATAP